VPIPTKVSIGGTTLEVLVGLEHCGEDNYGRLNWDEKTIGIADTDELNQWSSLYHEVFHAATHVSGLYWALPPELEEAIVRMLEQIALPAIKELVLEELTM